MLHEDELPFHSSRESLCGPAHILSAAPLLSSPPLSPLLRQHPSLDLVLSLVPRASHDGNGAAPDPSAARAAPAAGAAPVPFEGKV